MTGAIDHYRATLRLEPEYPGGLDQLRIPSCYIKYHQSPPMASKADPGDMSCVRNDQGTEMKCGVIHRQERQQQSCGYPGAEDQQRRYEQNTLTSIQVRKRKRLKLAQI